MSSILVIRVICDSGRIACQEAFDWQTETVDQSAVDSAHAAADTHGWIHYPRQITAAHWNGGDMCPGCAEFFRARAAERNGEV